MNRNSRLRLCWLFIGLVAAAGCSKPDEGVGATVEDDKDPSQSDDDDDDDDDDGRGRDTGASVMDAGSPDDHEIIDIAPPDATCAATSAEAPKVVVEKEVVIEVPREEIKPVAIYLMIDRSSSMIGYCPGSSCNAGSWDQAASAITAFARDPASASISVGLGYFPPLATIAQDQKAAMLCSGVSCATPTVALRGANDNAAGMADSLTVARPPMPDITGLFGPPPLFTPTECAIRGMDSFCKAHTMRTGEKCVGVLVTDGVPQGDCNVDTGTAAAPGALEMLTAAASTAGTPIFTLGLEGARFEFLHRLATAGKTDCTPMDPMTTACDARSGSAAFVAALNAIRDKVQVKETRIERHTETKEEPLDCEWSLPAPPEDMKFDKDKVNVVFTATGKSPRPLIRVSSEADCSKGPDGWRYDSESDPKKVLACPQACEQIKTSPGAKISIEFGCKGRSLE